MVKKAKTAVKVEGTSIDALIKEGKALGRIWSALHNVKQSTKANGFDTRLGKLLVELKAQSHLDSGQISHQTLTTHGIHNIDRRRRAEALWFVENEAKCREFMQASKKGFTSLTALQKAMRDADKPSDVTTSKVSNVGQSEPQANVVSDTGWQEVASQSVNVKPVTRTKMVTTIVKQCELNNLDLEAIVNDLQSLLAKQQKSA